MEIEGVTRLIEEGIESAQAHVNGDGRHFEATIISNQFEGQNKVKRQQLIYSVLSELMQRGDLHAINMTTLTEAEWQEEQA